MRERSFSGLVALAAMDSPIWMSGLRHHSSIAFCSPHLDSISRAVGIERPLGFAERLCVMIVFLSTVEGVRALSICIASPSCQFRNSYSVAPQRCGHTPQGVVMQCPASGAWVIHPLPPPLSHRHRRPVPSIHSTTFLAWENFTTIPPTIECT